MNARDAQVPVPDALRAWIDRISVAAYAHDADLRPLIHAPDPATVLIVTRLQTALLSRVDEQHAHQRARANLVHAAAVELSAATVRRPARVGEVARHVGVSERQLRNLFTTTVGVPPKQFARLSRVRTILDGAGRRSWSRLANDAGYYDQSHMTAEFREVMHVTPSAFAAGRLPTVPC